MRAFIALDMSEDFADDVAALARCLSRRVDGRFLRRETYHVTLAFLGDVDEAGARRAMDALDEACSGAEAPLLAPAGLGTFGRASDATLWMGLGRDPGLMEVAERLRGALRERGVSYDDTAFLPHVTLARRTRIPRATLDDLPFPLPEASRAATLYRSILESDGARYKPLYEVKFAASS